MSDPAISTNSVLALDFEQSWGVPKGSPLMRKIGFVSEGVTGTQQLIKNPSMRGDFNPSAPAYGRKAAQGSFTHVPTLKTAAFFARWLTGDRTTTGVGPDYSHVSKLKNLIPPGVVMEASFDIGGNLRFVRKIGCRLNRLGIQFAADGFLQFQGDVMGKDVTIETSPLDAILDDWAADDPIDHMMVAAADITLGGVANGAIQSGSIDFSANLQGDDYRVGGAGSRGSLLPGLYDISGSLKFVVESVALLTTLNSGTPSSLFIKWASGANKYFSIKLGNIYLDKVQPTVQGPGLVTVDAKFQAVYATGDQSSFVLTVANQSPGTDYV